MRVAAIQHDIVWEDGPATRARLLPMIKTAADGGAQLIALTEMYATGFSMDPARVAEPEGGPNEQFLREQAAANRAWLVASIAQTRAEGRPRNVAVIAGPDGELHRYAKIHPFSYAGEDEKYDAGSELITRRLDGLAVTPLVCYDLRFADCFWAVRGAHRSVRRRRELAGRRGVITGALYCARGRSRTRPTCSASTASAWPAGSTTSATAQSSTRPAGRSRRRLGPRRCWWPRWIRLRYVLSARSSRFLADRGQMWQVRTVDHSTS